MPLSVAPTNQRKIRRSATFWNDRHVAEKGDAGADHARCGSLAKMQGDLEDAATLVELGEAEGDKGGDRSRGDPAALRALKAEGATPAPLEAAFRRTDANDTYVEVHSGAGGTELRLGAHAVCACTCAGPSGEEFDVELIEETDASEAGIKSATIIVKGHNAHGWLKTEVGRAPARAHFHVRFQCAPAYELRLRLGSISRGRPRSARSEVEGGAHRTLIAPPGPGADQGGRSAVRITPLPTIVVACQSERSQHKNRATAWNMLRARLYELELQKREDKANADAASKTDIGWGHQIRSYVLQPYRVVKDLRTGHVPLARRRPTRGSRPVRRRHPWPSACRGEPWRSRTSNRPRARSFEAATQGKRSPSRPSDSNKRQ